MQRVEINDSKYRLDYQQDSPAYQQCWVSVFYEPAWKGLVVPICDILIEECGDQLITRTWRELTFP